MSERATPTHLVALRRRRDEVIEALTDGYAADLLGDEELERRLEAASKATDLATLDALVEDLPAAKGGQPPPLAMVPADAPPATKSLVAVLGGVTRKGRWTLPRVLRVFTLLGGAEIDLRECAFPPGLTEIKVFAIFGGVEVIVPPNLAIECEGTAILGGFESVERGPAPPDPDAPRVHISGFALFGGAEISTRLPGETVREAKKRRKRERKAKLLEG